MPPKFLWVIRKSRLSKKFYLIFLEKKRNRYFKKGKCNLVWLQYHIDSKLQSPLSTTDTHLVRTSDTLVDYANCHKLSAFRRWVNLTHEDTFIHNPFDFSSVNGRKTQDRVSQTDWDVLKSHCHMFHKPLPRFDVPSYSIHVDCGAHVLFHDATITRQLISMASHASEPSGLLLPP
jgi:hypothetical protein